MYDFGKGVPENDAEAYVGWSMVKGMRLNLFSLQPVYYAV
jgi:hypothetical protein